MSKMDYEAMATEQLRELLRRDCDGEITLDTDTILTICGILVRRGPRRRTAEEAWESFCRHYLPEIQNDL